MIESFEMSSWVLALFIISVEEIDCRLVDNAELFVFKNSEVKKLLLVLVGLDLRVKWRAGQHRG